MIGQRAKNGAWFGDVLDEEFVGEVGEQRAHRPWPQRKTANDVHCLHGGSSKTSASLFGRLVSARLCECTPGLAAYRKTALASGFDRLHGGCGLGDQQLPMIVSTEKLTRRGLDGG